jgi:hypothetical protein
MEPAPTAGATAGAWPNEPDTFLGCTPCLQKVLGLAPVAGDHLAAEQRRHQGGDPLLAVDEGVLAGLADGLERWEGDPVVRLEEEEADAREGAAPWYDRGE